MLLLANENFPRVAVDALRAEGHNVLWIRTDYPGATDEQVLHAAQADKRILLTLDKDFGELAFRSGLPADCGVILFRLTLSSPEYIGKIAVAALSITTEWSGHFAVVEESRVRLVPLPVQ